MSNSRRRSSGCRANSVVRGRISSVRESSTGLPVVTGWRSSMEQGPISSAAIVIGSPMPRSAEDRYDRALRRANNIRMRLGGEPGIASAFPGRPKGMHHQTYERLQSAVLNAEILAQERLVIALARLQRSDRRTSVGPLVGQGRNSGHEPGGECGDTSPAARRQLRIRPLQCAPARGAVATYCAALGGSRGIFGRCSTRLWQSTSRKGRPQEHLVEELAGVIWRKRRLRLGENAAHHRALMRAPIPINTPQRRR